MPMDITDIMISFWVSYDGKPFRIAGISGSNVTLDDGQEVGIDMCQPVHITPDILEEAGFFGAKERFVFGSGTNMLILSYDSTEENWTMSVSLHETTIRMKFIHELQTALKSHHRSDISIDVRRCNMELRKFNFARVGNVNRMLLDRTDEGWRVDGIDDVVPYGNIEKIEIAETLFTEKENRFICTDGIYELDMKETGNGDFIVRYSENEQWTIENKRNGKCFRGSVKFFNQLQNILAEVGIPADLVPDKTESEVAEMLDEAFK